MAKKKKNKNKANVYGKYKNKQTWRKIKQHFWSFVSCIIRQVGKWNELINPRSYQLRNQFIKCFVWIGNMHWKNPENIILGKLIVCSPEMNSCGSIQLQSYWLQGERRTWWMAQILLIQINIVNGADITH